MTTFLKPGATVALTACYSEAACHTKIAGRTIVVTIGQEYDGSLSVHPGSPYGYGLTLSEIGFAHTHDWNWYVPDHCTPRQDLERLLGSKAAVVNLGVDDHHVVRAADIYLGGKLAETSLWDPWEPEHWSITYRSLDGAPLTRESGNRYFGGAAAVSTRLAMVHGITRQSMIGFHVTPVTRLASSRRGLQRCG